MGSRKRLIKEKNKELSKKIVSAKLKDYPTSPRKMRLVANLIRGLNVYKALGILKYTKNHASVPLEKLLLSAISNWQVKNEDKDLDNVELYIKYISVDSASQLKRINTAPQGRAHRIRKRSNHVNIILEDKNIK